MPRSDKPPSYRLYKRTGQAVVTLDGRTVYLGVHGTPESREAYDRLIGEWLTNGRRLPTADRSELSVTDLISSYRTFAEGYYRKNGQSTPEFGKIGVTMRSLRRLYGRTSAAAFGPLELKTVRTELIRAGGCRSYVNEQTSQIKRMFKWAVENAFVPPSVHHGLQAVAGLKRGRSADVRETEPVRPVPEKHITAALACVSGQVKAMIELQLLTGMRSGEVRQMRGCDLDTTGRVWFYRPASHKCEHYGHTRTIYLGPRAQETLKPFLKADTTACLFSPKDAVAERRVARRAARKSKVQPSQLDRRKKRSKRRPRDHFTRFAYFAAIARACKKAGVIQWCPLQLRHNAGTRFRKEFGLEAAQILLGHKSAQTTEIYAERDTDRAVAVAEKVG